MNRHTLHVEGPLQLQLGRCESSLGARFETTQEHRNRQALWETLDGHERRLAEGERRLDDLETVTSIDNRGEYFFETTATIPDDATIVMLDATTAAFTLTFPAVATGSRHANYLHIVRDPFDTSANLVTLDGSGSENIHGAATQTIAAGETLVFKAYLTGDFAGKDWVVIS